MVHPQKRELWKARSARSPVALVTGGASGIGLACVRRFLADGWRVAIADLRPTADSKAIHADGALTFYRADVRSLPRAQAVVAAVDRRWGRIDALVCCAGISRAGMLEKMTMEDWEAVLDVDLTGVFSYFRAAAPLFERQRSGKVVAVSSTLALRARHGLTAYVAAKAGVIGLVRAAARDLGRFGVNVNAVCPGLVRTPLTEGVPEEVRKKLREETALGRIAEPEDVAGVIRFLCSDEARHITGEAIRVDGGQLA